MKFGVFLPVSGRAASRKTLMQAAQQAEALGYDSVWAADRLVHPWKIETTYPYSKEATFIVPPDRPFFDTMTCLAFLAGCTEKIELGMSVMVCLTAIRCTGRGLPRPSTSCPPAG